MAGPIPAPVQAATTDAATAIASDLISTDTTVTTDTRADWHALRQAVTGCTRCSLQATRRQALPGSGHPEARWLIVGDPPSAEEDIAGEPFAGEAGRLLDRMLAALQLTRADDGSAEPAQRVYLVNALRCLPPPGDHPGATHWAACETHLLAQIALLQPRVLLTMGRFAAQALLRSSEPLGRLRGRVHRYRDVPLVVTYHPGFLLRNPDFKAAAWDDLCLAARCFDSISAPSSSVAASRAG